MSNRLPAARPPVLYRLALTAVAAAMAVLPCLYVALIALVVYGIYLFATQYFVGIWTWPESQNRPPFSVQLIFSCTPIVVGFAMVCLMLRPIFARRAEQMPPPALDPTANARFDALLREVCRLTGAPIPRRIELSCELNASARLEHGLRGFFGRDRLILSLGMLMVAGLTQRELAAVLAHELGHFRQRAGMRMSYLIRTINAWFARMVYERGGWTGSLDGLADRPGGQHYIVLIMVLCTHFGVLATRGVLWSLMMAGHMVSAAFMREMEHDADRTQTRVAGSAALETTMGKLAVLHGVYGQIFQTMGRSWQQQRLLPDNLPGFVEYGMARVDPGSQAALMEATTRGKTAWMDTHPSVAERLRRARRRADPGGELSDAPARELFNDFGVLGCQVTRAHYEDVLKLPLRGNSLLPLEPFLQAAANLPPPPPLPSELPRPKRAAKPGKTASGGYDPRRYLGRQAAGDSRVK